MTGAADQRLDALLHNLPAAPPMPADLKARVLAAAAATPQETRPAYARRNAQRDRRGKWLRRPLFIGTAALGLVFTSAVAATLAGVPIPQKIAAVFFPEEKAPEPKQVVAPPHRTPRPAPSAAAPVETAAAAPAADAPVWAQRPNPWRRLFLAERMIEARRAMGLPTPGADRIQRQLRRRAEMWQSATPEQRAAWIQRQQLQQDVRLAMLSTPEGRAELARQDRMQRRRLQGQIAMPPGSEQRAERQRLVREWRARRMAGIPLSSEEQALRQERQQWREARRARWQIGADESGPAVPSQTEGPPSQSR
jgi:hypothetical protein